jgi:hypothetical protein
MLIIGPLLGTFLFSPAPEYREGFGIADFREILRHVLLGVFFSLGGIGLVIWKSIRRRSSENEQPADAHLQQSDRGA